MILSDTSPCPVEADPITNPLCTGPCTSPLDCDGLPDHRDPWTTCNQVFYADGFADSNTPGWGRAYCDNQVQASCGLLHFNFQPNYTLWAWASSAAPGAALPGAVLPSHLVEMRVVPVQATKFAAAFTVATNTLDITMCSPFQYTLGAYRRCKAEVVPGKLSLHNQSAGVNKGDEYWTGSTSLHELVIQGYTLNGTHHCRVYSAGKLLLDVPAAEAKVQGAVVLLELSNDDLTGKAKIDVDYLRIFSP